MQSNTNHITFNAKEPVCIATDERNNDTQRYVCLDY